MPSPIRVLRSIVVSFAAVLLAGCALQPAERPDHLLQDRLFGPPAEHVGVDDLFALSDPMRAFAAHEIAHQMRTFGRTRGLYEALSRQGKLRLDYESTVTRNAADAFEARAGNCLSLVLMTAAFAKELNIPFEYQVAIHETAWSRSGGLYLRNGHVNLLLGGTLPDRYTTGFNRPLMIDFLPAEDLSGLRTRTVAERTIIAMYMNNRATEALVNDRIDDAYAWARGAISSDPLFLKTYNTLGVIYRRHDNLDLAARAFRYVLERDAGNTAALANLAQLERQRGHAAAADVLLRDLASLEGTPPFHFFMLGQEAMQRGDYKVARRMFTREIDRDPYYHEFHFWLAQAEYRLGDLRGAQAQLALAIENSTTRGDRDLYAAKLAWLRGQK